MGELPAKAVDSSECCGGESCETDVRDAVREHYADLVQKRGSPDACWRGPQGGSADHDAMRIETHLSDAVA